MVSPAEIQHTRLKGELVFQSFCLDLFRRYWKDDEAQAHGRSGQRQHGADITGQDNRNGFQNAAVQCKASETDDPRQLSVQELIDEVELAKGFVPKLDSFIVAYGGSRDAELQRKAMEITAEHAKTGLFKVTVWSWDDIIARALDYPEVIQKLLVHNEVPTVTALDPKRPKGDIRQELEAAMLNTLAKFNNEVPVDPAKTGDPILDAQLDLFRDQLRAGNGRMMLQPLRDFVAGLPEGASARARFRSYANLGAALAQSDDIEGAAIAFDSAAEAVAGTADGHTYGARAAYLRGNRDLAFREASEAMRLGPDRLACTIYLESVPEPVDLEAVEKDVANFIDEVDVASSMARHYAAQGRHVDAIRVARGIAVQDWQKDSVLAVALIAQFEDDSAIRIGAPMTAAQQLQLDEARVLLERAWSKVVQRSDRATWCHVGANLCSVYRMLSLEEKADDLALQVYAIDPRAPTIAQRAALAHMRKSDFEQAQAVLEAVLPDADAALKLLAGNVAISRADWPKADGLAEQAFRDAVDDDDKANAAELMIYVRMRRGDPLADLLSLADRLRPQFSASIGFESRVAEVARRSGDAAAVSAAESRLRAFGPIEALDPLQRFLLADASADAGNWTYAADLLEGLHTIDRPSEILKRRLFALYRADRRPEARALFETLRDQALESVELLRLGAAIYERSGMLKEALQQLNTAMGLDREDLGSRLDWVRLSARSGNPVVVERWAKRASLPASGDPLELMELAQMFDHFGQRRKALQLGYRTLRAHWGASERLHMGYMGLFLIRSRSEAFLQPSIVGEDCVVFVKDDNGGARSYRIEAGAAPSQEVLSPEHPFARKLLGKAVGDTVVLEAGIGQDTSWTIVEIKHKYLDLFHQAFELHETLFPNSRAIGKFHVDPNDQDSFEPVFEQARSRSRQVDNAVQLYRTTIMPIDGIAAMLGTDAIDASRGLRFRSGMDLDVCIGEFEEREIALRAVEAGGRILVDVLTISIWDELGMLEDLVRMGVRPCVVQSTIDALAQRVQDAQINIGQTGGSLEARDEKIYFTESTRAQRQEYAAAQQAVLDWVRQNADLVPTEPFKNELLAAATELLSHSTLDTLTTALATDVLLVMEDRRARQIAQSIGLARTTWTQPLLLKYQHDGSVSRDRYVELLARMVRQKIGFVAIRTEDVEQAAALGVDAADFQTLCESMMRPNVDIVSLVQVVADFIARPWLDGVPADPRFASVFLNLALSRRDGFRAFGGIIRKVARNIETMGYPQGLLSRIWKDYAVNFIEGHFIRGALRSVAPPARNVPRRRRRVSRQMEGRPDNQAPRSFRGNNRRRRRK